MEKNVKPNVFLIGAPKSGTTAIASYMSSHPDVYFSSLKEPNYFCSDFSSDFRAIKCLSLYESLFSPGACHKIVAEGSVTYLFSSEAVNNILKYNPCARFIVCIRNPVDLVVSMHRQQINNLEEDEEDFFIAWDLQELRKKGRYLPKYNRDPKLIYYKDWGMLGEQVERLFAKVDRSQVHIIVFDELKELPRDTYLKLLEFLGLLDDGRKVFDLVNEAFVWRFKWLWKILRYKPRWLRFVASKLSLANGGKPLGVYNYFAELLEEKTRKKIHVPALSVDQRKCLYEFYKLDIEKLEKLTQRSLSKWKI